MKFFSISFTKTWASSYTHLESGDEARLIYTEHFCTISPVSSGYYGRAMRLQGFLPGLPFSTELNL